MVQIDPDESGRETGSPDRVIRLDTLYQQLTVTAPLHWLPPGQKIRPTEPVFDCGHPLRLQVCGPSAIVEGQGLDHGVSVIDSQQVWYAVQPTAGASCRVYFRFVPEQIVIPSWPDGDVNFDLSFPLQKLPVPSPGSSGHCVRSWEECLD